MIKHVGKHNNKKVVILYRKVPGEGHMCLAVYSETLPRTVHDSVMSTLESPVGQQENQFADALFRQTMADGRNALTALHSEGYIKKIPTNQVVMTPTSTSSARLDELNDIIDKMAGGAEASKRLADLDNNSGMSGSKEGGRDVGEPVATASPQASTTSVLSDDVIAKSLKEQATQMRAESKRLIEEAKRLEVEAKELTPKKKAKVESSGEEKAEH